MELKIHFLLKRRRILETSDLITLKQYAKENHISYSTARDWIQKKRLVGKKFGGKWFVLRR